MIGKRFSLEQHISSAGIVELSPSESRHLAARRVKPEDIIELLDPSGSRWEARILSVKPYALQVLKSLPPQKAINLTLAVAIPQANRAPILVEKVTELGVARIIPLLCERSVAIPKSSGNFVERWSRIAVSAVEQSGAPLPEITLPTAFEVAISGSSNSVILSPKADISLSEVLQSREKGTELCIFIGPEGGFSARELTMAKKNGSTPAVLGGTILRIETAAIAAVALYNLCVFGRHKP